MHTATVEGLSIRIFKTYFAMNYIKCNGTTNTGAIRAEQKFMTNKHNQRLQWQNGFQPNTLAPLADVLEKMLVINISKVNFLTSKNQIEFIPVLS